MKRVLTLLIILMLAFIWGNSMLPKQESSDLSSDVVSFIQKLLPEGMSPDTANHIVRKAAHFGEFFILGFFMCMRFLKEPDGPFTPLFFCISAAIIDETIQIFTGRGPSVFDVMIDSAGAALCMGLLLLIIPSKMLKGHA